MSAVCQQVPLICYYPFMLKIEMWKCVQSWFIQEFNSLNGHNVVQFWPVNSNKSQHLFWAEQIHSSIRPIILPSIHPSFSYALSNVQSNFVFLRQIENYDTPTNRFLTLDQSQTYLQHLHVGDGMMSDHERAETHFIVCPYSIQSLDYSILSMMVGEPNVECWFLA